jgi:hypothetical protein
MRESGQVPEREGNERPGTANGGKRYAVACDGAPAHFEPQALNVLGPIGAAIVLEAQCVEGNAADRTCDADGAAAVLDRRGNDTDAGQCGESRKRRLGDAGNADDRE